MQEGDARRADAGARRLVDEPHAARRAATRGWPRCRPPGRRRGAAPGPSWPGTCRRACRRPSGAEQLDVVLARRRAARPPRPARRPSRGARAPCRRCARRARSRRRGRRRRRPCGRCGRTRCGSVLRACASHLICNPALRRRRPTPTRAPDGTALTRAVGADARSTRRRATPSGSWSVGGDGTSAAARRAGRAPRRPAGGRPGRHRQRLRPRRRAPGRPRRGARAGRHRHRPRARWSSAGSTAGRSSTSPAPASRPAAAAPRRAAQARARPARLPRRRAARRRCWRTRSRSPSAPTARGLRGRGVAGDRRLHRRLRRRRGDRRRRPRDGQLDLVVVPAGRALALPAVAPGACAAGTLADQPDVVHVRADAVKVRVPPGTAFNVDGEIVDAAGPCASPCAVERSP